MMRHLLAVVIVTSLSGLTQAQMPAPIPGNLPPPSANPAPVNVQVIPLPSNATPIKPSACNESSACNTCTTPMCCACPKLYGRADYMLAWIEGQRTPPLVTRSPAGTPVSSAGVLGAAGTQTVVGGSNFGDDPRSGFRFEIGTWLFDCKLGIEAGFFYLGSRSDTGFAGSADGSTILARPYIDATTGRPAAQLVSFPGVLAGSTSVSARTSNVLGADLLGRTPLCCQTECDGGYRLDALFGYRYLSLDDQLTIREELRPLSPFVAPGSTISLFDRFETTNRFHGGRVGLGWQCYNEQLSLELNACASLGRMSNVVTIRGSTTSTVPGATPVVRQGGLLALPTNIGTYRSRSFAVIPDGEIRVGFRLSECVRLTVGYSVLVMTDVARAGEQIDVVVNPTRIPSANTTATGPARPAFVLNRSDVWIHGITAGVEFAW